MPQTEAMEEDELDAVLAQVGVMDPTHVARLSKEMTRWHYTGMTSGDIENEVMEEHCVEATVRLESDAQHEVMEGGGGFMEGEEGTGCC